MTSQALLTLSVERLRLAQREHCDALLALLDEYASEPVGGAAPLSAYARTNLIDALRPRIGYVGLLAFQGLCAVGLVNAFEAFSTFAARPVLNVHDLFVKPAYRGRGIGQALLWAAEREARARGCVKLTLEVLSGNTRALSSYERFGFRRYQLAPEVGHALFLEKPLG
jgi:ribosomal protein S18 acetylase RimI-like enzyme